MESSSSDLQLLCLLCLFGLLTQKKWSVGFFILSILTIGLSLGNLGLLFNTVSHTNKVYNFYKNSEGSAQWEFHMAFISQDELSNYGCKAKYLSREQCANDESFFIQAWESNAQNSQVKQCLNRDFWSSCSNTHKQICKCGQLEFGFSHFTRSSFGCSMPIYEFERTDHQ